jgi:hypothetical protein
MPTILFIFVFFQEGPFDWPIANIFGTFIGTIFQQRNLNMFPSNQNMFCHAFICPTQHPFKIYIHGK